MRMSVTPSEIAQHLVDEMGHTAAIEAYQYHLGRCIDDETAGIWSNIGKALQGMDTLKAKN